MHVSTEVDGVTSTATRHGSAIQCAKNIETVVTEVFTPRVVFTQLHRAVDSDVQSNEDSTHKSVFSSRGEADVLRDV
jgi:hypothetical protein